VRRRRRQSTQTIRKKTIQSPPLSSNYSSKKTGGIGRKIFYYFLTIIILSFIAYYLYNFTSPDEPPGGEEISQEITTGSSEEVVEPPQTPAPFEHKIQIEILNGCGVSGIAKIFQSKLRENGFDVVNTENYIEKGKVNWKIKNSFIIDQIGVSEQAKMVANSLGIPLTNIESRTNPASIYDVSVVIGKDYKKFISE
jgi:hypothetical protein